MRRGSGKQVKQTYVLGDLKDETFISLGDFDLKCVENLRQFIVELDVDDGTDNLSDLSSEE
jgi:hypothetical protein